MKESFDLSSGGGNVNEMSALKIDLHAERARLNGRDLYLTRLELKFLALVHANAGRVVTKPMFLDYLYASQPRQAENKILDVVKYNVMCKLGPEGKTLIQDIWGRGPIMNPLPEEARSRLLTPSDISLAEGMLYGLIRRKAANVGRSTGAETLLPRLGMSERFTPAKKAAVVVAVRHGLISREAAQGAYCATGHEIREWEILLDAKGIKGLRATRANQYFGEMNLYSHPAPSQ